MHGIFNIFPLGAFAMAMAVATDKADVNLAQRDTINFTEICDIQSLTADDWINYGMNSFILVEATAMQPYKTSFPIALQSMLPSLKNYYCGFDLPCDTTAIQAACTDQPQAAFALLAVAHFSNYFQEVFSAFEVAVTTMTPAFATFPNTFNVNNYTTLPDTSDASLVGAIGYLLGSLAGFAGIFAATAAKAGFGAIGATTYLAGSFATVGNANTTQSGNVEVQFQSFQTIEGYLSAMQKNLTSSISQFVKSRLENIPEDEDQGNGPDTAFEYDPTQLPQIFVNGTFAANVGDLPSAAIAGFTSVLAAPGVNTMWSYDSVVIARVSKASLPEDPCDGDNLLPSGVKYCDSDGFAYILQGLPTLVGASMTGYNAPIDDMSDYAVPGFDKIGEYNLTVETITQSAWQLQQKDGAGSAGPSESDFNSYITSTGPENLTPQDYTFFNLPVCDMDTLPITSATNDFITNNICSGKPDVFSGQPSTIDTTVCTFLVRLTCTCGAASYAPGMWPWATNGSEVCYPILNA